MGGTGRSLEQTEQVVAPLGPPSGRDRLPSRSSRYPSCSGSPMSDREVIFPPGYRFCCFRCSFAKVRNPVSTDEIFCKMVIDGLVYNGDEFNAKC
jgi:hypothetical protein